MFLQVFGFTRLKKKKKKVKFHTAFHLKTEACCFCSVLSKRHEKCCFLRVAELGVLFLIHGQTYGEGTVNIASQFTLACGVTVWSEERIAVWPNQRWFLMVFLAVFWPEPRKHRTM